MPAIDEAELIQGPRSREDLVRFSHGDYDTVRNFLKVLDVLADHSDEWMSMSDLVAATDIPKRYLHGTFSALRRHIRVHFGRGSWPLAEYIGGSSLGKDRQMYYRLTSETADVWHDVRSNG